MKLKTIWGGPSVFSNRFGQKVKGSTPTNLAPFPRDMLNYDSNGYVLAETSDTDLHIVADDLTTGSNWVSRVGSYVAGISGQPTIGSETPFYPSGGFDGVGYRAATTGYTSSDYYSFPSDTQHDITGANQISYEIILKVGHGVVDEEILSRYLFPDYNLRARVAIVGGLPYLDVYVGTTGNPPHVSVLVDQYTYNFIHILWDGPSLTLSVGVNGIFTSNTGSGTVIVPAGPCALFVGCDSNFADYMTTGQIIEIIRHRVLMTQSTAKDRVRLFGGLQSAAGELPQYYERSTRGEIFVNNKIFSFGSYFPRMNEKGVLLQNFYNGFIKNNFFEQDLPLLNQWAYFTSGSSTITTYSDADSFSEIGGTGIKVYTDGSGNPAYFYQTTATQYQANYRTWIDLWVKSIDSGCYPAMYILNSASGKYYDVQNQVWSINPVLNTFTTTSTNKEKFTFSIVNEGANSTYLYYFEGFSVPGNINKSYVVYGISDNMSEQKQCVKVNRDNSNVSSFDYLRYNKSMVKMDKDRITFSVTYQSAASILPYSYMSRYVFADSAGFLKMDVGTNNLRLSDSSGSSALISGSAYTADEKISYSVKWDKNVAYNLSISDITESISASASCTNDIDNNATYFYIGCNPAASNDVIDAYIQNVRFYEIPSTLPVRTSMQFNSNGYVLETAAFADLQIVADDLTSGSNWSSRIGSFVAAHTGSPTVGVETPFYPSGGWNGTGYRTSVADFTTSKYYKFPYNIAHALTATSTVTYEMVLQLGILANEETFFARYITAQTKYNFRVYAKNDGSSNYRLYVEVDHATTNAVCNMLMPQMSFVMLTWTYDGASKVLKMYVNGIQVVTGSGNIGSATGVGAVTNDASTDFFVGLSDTVVGKPLVKSKIIETMRHQTILSDADILSRFQKFSGVMLTGGIYPSAATVRNTYGYIPVNGKVWGFSNSFPLMNQYGLLNNVAFGCSMYSTAITDGTGGASNLTITAGVTVAAEANAINSQVNGQTLTIPATGATLYSAMWVNLGMTQSVKSAATIVWRPDLAGSSAFIYIYDETTTKYWVSGTTWSASPTAIDLSSFIISGAGTLTDPYISSVPFTTEAFGAGSHRIDVFVHNNVTSSVTKRIKVYWCQVCDSAQFAAEPLTVIRPTGGAGTVFLGTQYIWPATIISYVSGQINMDFRPIFTSTQPRLSPSNALTILSGNSGNNFLNLSIGSANFTFKDNAAHSVTLAPTYTKYELLQFQLQWSSTTGRMIQKIINKGLSSSAVYTSPLSAGDFRFGTSSQSPGGYINNVIIR